MRSSLRLFSPALRNVASTSRSTGSFRTRTLVGFVAGGVAAYALVPHKQNLMLDAPVRKTRSAWDDTPAPKASEPEVEAETTPETATEEDPKTAAFDPVTGEINWDCPCLGGMAHGPCGPEFQEAFSCFIYSEEEPKGINCVEKFKGMQDCFREHPDVYGEEISDEAPPSHDDASLEELVKEAEEYLAEPVAASSPSTPSADDVKSTIQAADLPVPSSTTSSS